jgi:hypothetical protein
MATSDYRDLLPLVKFLEEHDIKATFWFGPENTITGVPHYKGFDIDIGEMFEVDDKMVAMHDFRSIVLANMDHREYRERMRTA